MLRCECCDPHLAEGSDDRLAVSSSPECIENCPGDAVLSFLDLGFAVLQTLVELHSSTARVQLPQFCLEDEVEISSVPVSLWCLNRLL